MPKTIQKEDIKVKVNILIRPESVTSHQRSCWKKWWAHIIISASEELDNEEEIKHA